MTVIPMGPSAREVMSARRRMAGIVPRPCGPRESGIAGTRFGVPATLTVARGNHSAHPVL